MDFSDSVAVSRHCALASDTKERNEREDTDTLPASFNNSLTIYERRSRAGYVKRLAKRRSRRSLAAFPHNGRVKWNAI